MILDNYKLYTIQCKENKYFYNIVDLIVNNIGEIRLAKKFQTINFFHCKSVYCIEFLLSNKKRSRCLFELKTIQLENINSKENTKYKIILNKNGIHKNTFILLENKLELYYKEFSWKECQIPELISKLVYGWRLNTCNQQIDLLITTDGMIRVFKQHFIKQISLDSYLIRSKYGNIFLQYRIVIEKDKLPYITDKNFCIEIGEKIRDIFGYLVFYKDNEFYNKLMYFWIMDGKLIIHKKNIIYTGNYWLEFSPNIFSLPFKINGFHMEFKYAKLYDDYKIDVLEGSVENLLLYFAISEDITIVRNINLMVFIYQIFYQGHYMGHLITKENEIRIDPVYIKDEIYINNTNNKTYIVSYSKEKRDFLKESINGKFASFDGHLIILTQYFSAAIESVCKNYELYSFNGLNNAKI